MVWRIAFRNLRHADRAWSLQREHVALRSAVPPWLHVSHLVVPDVRCRQRQDYAPGDQLSIFTGVGPIGWTRQFVWSDFKSVRELSQWNTNNWNRQGQFIALEGKRRVTFGSMLSTGQRYFLVNALRSALSGTTPSPIYAGQAPASVRSGRKDCLCEFGSHCRAWSFERLVCGDPEEACTSRATLGCARESSRRRNFCEVMSELPVVCRNVRGDGPKTNV